MLYAGGRRARPGESGASRSTAAFAATDNRYRYYFHPAAEHLTFAGLDDWRKEAAYTEGLELDRNPSRVVFGTAPFLDAPQYGARPRPRVLGLEAAHQRWRAGLRHGRPDDRRLWRRGPDLATARPTPAPTPSRGRATSRPSLRRRPSPANRGSPAASRASRRFEIDARRTCLKGGADRVRADQRRPRDDQLLRRPRARTRGRRTSGGHASPLSRARRTNQIPQEIAKRRSDPVSFSAVSTITTREKLDESTSSTTNGGARGGTGSGRHRLSPSVGASASDERAAGEGTAATITIVSDGKDLLFQGPSKVSSGAKLSDHQRDRPEEGRPAHLLAVREGAACPRPRRR